MAALLYRFGAFRLDPHARELLEHDRRIELPLSTIDCLIYLIRHRDRPIGRDELASAVWGRVDVSEVSLSHAIMRLRRLLGDDGNAQRVIRTVPRLGYRWVLEDTREVAVDERAGAAADGVGDMDVIELRPGTDTGPALEDAPRGAHARYPSIATTNTSGPSPTPARALIRRSGLALVAVIAAAVIGVVTYRALPQHDDAAKPIATEPVAANTALVLPVGVDAGEESTWMRLGLMDLVATQLRRGEVATIPSESVVAVLKARSGEAAADPRDALPAHWLVHGRIALDHGSWTMQLDAHAADRDIDVATHAGDALSAARAAADELLIRLGRTPPKDESGDLALALATLRQRVGAAVLTGRLDIARRLIDDAPAPLQTHAEIALAQARVAFFAGDYAGSRAQTEALLERLPADAPAGLRARVANAFGAAAFRLGRFDDAASAFAQTQKLLQDGAEPGVLADAYRGSGSIAGDRNQLEAAAQAYGRARTLYELGNDPFGVATIDLNLGINAMQRGQPAAALPLLQGVRTRLQRLAAPDALAATEITLVEVQLNLLDHAGALATSSDFAAPGHDAGNPRQRAQFTFARAAALAGAGRLDEADRLLARLRDLSDADADAIARALGDALAARIALQRGDAAKAAELSAAAQTPALEQRNRGQYAEAALLHASALRMQGNLAAAAAEIARVHAWDAAAPEAEIALALALAEAEQAGAEGHQDTALRRYAEAMALAGARAVPEDVVRVGLPYVRELVAAHRLDEAVAVNGRIAPWADRDMRAAWSEALVYSALGRGAAAEAALERARRLAGERSLSDVVTAAR